MCLIASEDTDGAIESLHVALGLDPDDPQAHAPLGEIFYRKKEWPAARKHLRTAIAGGYLDVHLICMLAHALHELGDTPAAGRTLADAASLDPDSPEITMALALFHKEQGDFSRAVSLAASP